MDPNDLKPAPEPLRVVQEFVNTRSNLRDLDILADVEGAAEWLDEHELVSSGPLAVTEADRRRLISFRERLRGLLVARTIGAGEDSATTTGLQYLDRDVLLRVGFDSSGGPRLRPAEKAEGVERAVALMLAAMVESEGDGTWERLKACRNEACRWVFYDSSKNRSGSWCDMDTCGARHKMRAYRKRKSG